MSAKPVDGVYLAAKYLPSMLGGAAISSGAAALTADDDKPGQAAAVGAGLGALGAAGLRKAAPLVLNKKYLGDIGHSAGSVIEAFPRIVSSVMKNPGSISDKLHSIHTRMKLQLAMAALKPALATTVDPKGSAYNMGKLIGVGAGSAIAPALAGYTAAKLMNDRGPQEEYIQA